MNNSENLNDLKTLSESALMGSLLRNRETYRDNFDILDNQWNLVGCVLLHQVVKERLKLQGSIPPLEVMADLVLSSEASSVDKISAQNIIEAAVNQKDCSEIDSHYFQQIREKRMKLDILASVERNDWEGVKEAIDTCQKSNSKDTPLLFSADMLKMSNEEIEKIMDCENLLNNRFLASGRTLLINGQSGIGKSSLIFQLAVLWVLGRGCLGFNPTRALKVLILGDEDDQLDIKDWMKSFQQHYQLSDSEMEMVLENLIIPDIEGRNIFEVAEECIKKYKIDVYVINPAGNFKKDAGCKSVEDSEVVNAFMKRIRDINKRYKVQSIVIHHGNKPRTGVQRSQFDAQFDGAGTAVWANAHRAVISLTRNQDDKDGRTFELIVAKGARRAGFVKKLIKQSTPEEGIIYWSEATEIKKPYKPTKLTPAQERIYKRLDANGKTATELGDETGTVKTNVKKLLDSIMKLCPEVKKADKCGREIKYYIEEVKEIPPEEAF